MRREKQQSTNDPRSAGTQVAFDFADGSKAGVKLAAPTARRSVSTSEPAPRGKKPEPVTQPSPAAKRASKPRLSKPVAEVVLPEPAKVSRATNRARKPAASETVASTSEVVVQPEVPTVPVPEVPAKRPSQRKARPVAAAPVEVQPVAQVEQTSPPAVEETAAPKAKQPAKPRVRTAKAQAIPDPAPGIPQPVAPPEPVVSPATKPARVRQAKAQTSVAVEAQKVEPPQVTELLQPVVEAKKRRVKAIAAAPQSQPPVAAAIPTPQTAAAPTPAIEPSETLPTFTPSIPVPVAAPVAPPTWRYVGAREEADRLYRRRFGTEDVPEPTVIAGTLAYALPALRRPLA